MSGNRRGRPSNRDLQLTICQVNSQLNQRYAGWRCRESGAIEENEHVNAERLQDGWLATGDLFGVDEEGFYFFRGRVDDMFNCGGENIYPKEVENLLLRHDQVFDASVVPVAHAVKGHVPVAMVMRREGSNLSEDEIKRFCLENGPAYAHPRKILVVDEMPLNAAAKVDRTKIQRDLTAAFAEELAGAV